MMYIDLDNFNVLIEKTANQNNELIYIARYSDIPYLDSCLGIGSTALEAEENLRDETESMLKCYESLSESEF